MNPEIPIDQPPHPSITANLPALTHLLCSLFATYREFCRFLYLLPNHRQIEHELPSYDSSASLADLIFTAVVALSRRGMIDPSFFAELAEHFPSRVRDIRTCAQASGVSFAHAQPRQNTPSTMAWNQHPVWNRMRTWPFVILITAGFAAAVWAGRAPPKPTTAKLEKMADKLEHSRMAADIRRYCAKFVSPGNEIRIEYAHNAQGDIFDIIHPYNSGGVELLNCAEGFTRRSQRRWTFGKSRDGRWFSVVF